MGIAVVASGCSRKRSNRRPACYSARRSTPSTCANLCRGPPTCGCLSTSCYARWYTPLLQAASVNATRTIPLLLDSGASDTVFSSKKLLIGTRILTSAHSDISVGNAAHPVVVKGEARPLLLLCAEIRSCPCRCLGS